MESSFQKKFTRLTRLAPPLIEFCHTLTNSFVLLCHPRLLLQSNPLKSNPDNFLSTRSHQNWLRTSVSARSYKGILYFESLRGVNFSRQPVEHNFWPCGCFAMAQMDKQTNRHHQGHGNSMTYLAWRAKSVKNTKSNKFSLYQFQKFLRIRVLDTH